MKLTQYLTLGLLFTLPALQAETMHQDHAMADGQMATANGQMTMPAQYAVTAKVIALDGDKVMLQHEAIPALGWPAMTMPFVLADTGLAKGLTPGLQIQGHFSPVKGDSPRLLDWQAKP
ncbi:copper-binding protein [Pseudaeromonas paramecii]|uniref:Copper-binding protein n=1 Tax=Pseudaeromonas paramecii TaxID=2138166 RepID=A0ABP8Q757_9GAMM